MHIEAIDAQVLPCAVNPINSGEFAVAASFLCREKHILSKNNVIGAIVIVVDVHVQFFGAGTL